MRLWSIHPQYLDSKGLVALWREALLAQKVLQGQTRGYTNHPQLLRFKQSSNPLSAISTYLRSVADEARIRGYQFDKSKIIKTDSFTDELPVTVGQLDFELQHLKNKLKVRDPAKYEEMLDISEFELHPLFTPTPGTVEEWEVISKN